MFGITEGRNGGGSGCSIQFGAGWSRSTAGGMRYAASKDVSEFGGTSFFLSLDVRDGFRVDLQLPHNYAVESDAELPPDPSRVLQTEFRVRALSQSAVVVGVRPMSGQRWVGVFAADRSPPSVTGIYSCP